MAWHGDDLRPAKPFLCTVEYRAMKASGTRGAIVNVTSAAGLRGGLGPAAYSASKAGVIALTQQAACECAPAGVRVNSVAPAYVSTVRSVSAAADGTDMLWSVP